MWWKNIDTLFICSANVWRSQIAEWYYNHFTDQKCWFSAALIENRLEKYNNKPEYRVVNTMKEDWIDISSQRIKLLTKEFCDRADKIILLLEPNLCQKSDFVINWQFPTKFLLDNYKDKIHIKKVQDPFWETNDKLRVIRNEIKLIVLDVVRN